MKRAWSLIRMAVYTLALGSVLIAAQPGPQPCPGGPPCDGCPGGPHCPPDPHGICSS
jgi:hypothetical protein